MIAHEFTPETWVHAEIFYNTVVTILLLVGLFLGLLFIIFGLYVKRFKAPILLGLGITIALLGIGYIGGNAHYKNYLTLARDATPNVRDREKSFFGYKQYSEFTLATYRRIQNVEGMKRLDIYEGHPIEHEITYLGFAYGSVYFKVGAQQYYLRTKPTFVEGVTPKLVGQYYTLKSSAKEFTEIGFFPQTNAYLENVVLPKSMETLKYEQQDGKMSKEFGASQTDWAVAK